MYAGVENPMKIIYRIEHLMETSQSDAFVIKPQRELCETLKKRAFDCYTRSYRSFRFVRSGAYIFFVRERFEYFLKIKIRKYHESTRRISIFFCS